MLTALACLLVLVRAACAGEEAALPELVLRSKAHWGYDAAFVEACRLELTVTAAQIDGGQVSVALDGQAPVGVAIVDLAINEPELVALFVEPSVIGRGVGSILLRAALEGAAAAGVEALVIESDPNAERFYLARGARRVGERRSASTSRSVPLQRITTTPP